MERRRLGRIGHMSSVIIYGGAMLAETPQDVADRSIELALDSGSTTSTRRRTTGIPSFASDHGCPASGTRSSWRARRETEPRPARTEASGVHSSGCRSIVST